MVRGLVVLALGALVLGRAEPAHAWTDAHVQTASATLRLAEDGQLEVALAVRVHVRGGWLESLEVAGLDPSLVLVDAAPVSVSDEGERFVSRASATDDGRVTLSFPRRGGPRRGHHEVVVRYRADLGSRFVAEGELARATWTFPGWQSGLDGVEVTLDAPRGARFVGAEDALVTLTRTREEAGGRTLLRWRRAHLPRTLAWELAFELPRASLVPGLTTSSLPPPDAAPDVPTASSTATAATVVSLAQQRRGGSTRWAPRPQVGTLFVGVTALLTLLLFSWEARRRGAVARFLLPLPLVIRAAAVIGALVAAHAEIPALPLLGLVVALTLPRTSVPRAARIGAWSRAGRAEIAEARRAVCRERVGPLGWIDATAPLGLGVFAALFFAASQLGPLTPGEVLLAALPPLLLTRHRLPCSTSRRLLRTAALASRLGASEGSASVCGAPELGGLALGGLALQLAVHRDVHGVVQDVRLRLVTASRAPGLLRLDVVCSEVGELAGLRVDWLGVVVTRESTPAERLVAAAFPDLPVVRGPAGRVARLVELPTLVAVARVVDVDTPRESRSSDVPMRPPRAHEQRLHA